MAVTTINFGQICKALREGEATRPQQKHALAMLTLFHAGYNYEEAENIYASMVANGIIDHMEEPHGNQSTPDR